MSFEHTEHSWMTEEELLTLARSKTNLTPLETELAARLAKFIEEVEREEGLISDLEHELDAALGRIG